MQRPEKKEAEEGRKRDERKRVKEGERKITMRKKYIDDMGKDGKNESLKK